MDFDAFAKTNDGRSMRYQRVVYVVSPSSSHALGVEQKYVKVGISKCDLQSRMRCYKTYWPSGITIHACAVVTQPLMSTRQDVLDVESSICESSALRRYRIRKTESFLNSNGVALGYVISSLRRNTFVHRVWVAGGPSVNQGGGGICASRYRPPTQADAYALFGDSSTSDEEEDAPLSVSYGGAC